MKQEMIGCQSVSLWVYLKALVQRPLGKQKRFQCKDECRQLDHIKIIYTSLQTASHASISSLNFYGLDALFDAQQTVSKHWRQLW